MSDSIEIWTDGACSGNPGPGGWGVLMRADGAETELHGGEPATTNNRMELMAPIVALEKLPIGAHVTLHTDSKYVVDGITSWIHSWKKRGWRKASGEAVLNRELWERLERAASQRKVVWRWVKGHSGHAENDRADALARLGCEENRPGRR